MKKKLVCFMLVGTMIFGMAGCGANDTGDKSSAKSEYSSDVDDDNEGATGKKSDDASDEDTKKAVKVTKESSFEDKWNYIPEYFTKIEYGFCDESKKPVQIVYSEDNAKDILDLINESENGIDHVESLGFLDVCADDEDIPNGSYNGVTYVLSKFGTPSAGYIANFNPYEGYYDEDDTPGKYPKLIYEYSDYVLTFTFLDIFYDRDTSEKDDSAKCICVHFMSKETYEDYFKTTMLILDYTGNTTPLGSYGTLEGYEPPKKSE